MTPVTMQTTLPNMSAIPVSPRPGTYTELSELGDLRREARRDPNAALLKVAQQFESLFIKMMLKSMRQASFGDPLFDSSQSKMYRDMFDNQISMNMAEGKGIGLAESLVRQLQRHVPIGPEKTQEKQGVEMPAAFSGRGLDRHKTSETAARADISASRPLEAGLRVAGVNAQDVVVEMKAVIEPGRAGRQDLPVSFSDPAGFVRQLWPLAEQAAQRLGVSPRVILAQAALETGWGRAINRREDGRSSFNLFNIKADDRWSGEQVVVGTLEYEAGVARRQSARFRAYDSFADSFDDYVNFLKSNPRYQQALKNPENPVQFITRLHQAGYATDPRYADKIINIMQRDDFDVSQATAVSAKTGRG